MPLDTAFSPDLSTPHAGRVAGAGAVQLDFVHSLTKEVTTVRGPEGSTIADLLAIAGVNHRRWGGGACWIEDAARLHDPIPIAREKLHRVRPKAGTITTVMLWPRGGGGSGGKSILRTLLMVVVMIAAAVAAFYLAPIIGPLIGITTQAGLAAVGSVIAGVVSVVGNLLISALIPPPRPRAAEERLQGLSDDRSAFFLQGTSNRAKPYGVIPIHLGRLRRYADLAAEWFTEVVGNDQYLRGLMVWGLGRLRVTELKIGETPLSEYEGVEVRTVEGAAGDGPPEIYTNDPHTEGLSIELTPATGWVSRVTQEDTDEIQIEIAFPAGLANVQASGRAIALTVNFEVRIAPAGGEDFTTPAWANADESGFGTPGVMSCTDATRTGQPRRVGRLKPDPSGNPSKQWRVDVRRTTVNETDPTILDESYWAALKSITWRLPIGAQLIGKLAYTEIRIKATGQLNGTVQELNAIVESYVQQFDEDGFTGVEALSRNNAELFAHIATHRSARRPIAATRLNWLNLVEWRDACNTLNQEGEAKWMYDRVFEGASSLGRVLDEIAACGRARRGMPGGKHGVIRDLPQTVPKQHFTPRNSWDYHIDISFRRRLHGVRVRYNKGGLGQEAEITIYDDGYSAANATELETAEAIGYSRESQVFCDWRYWLAVQRLRPHSHEIMADVEHLVSSRGALVRCTHDVPGFGLVSGRVKSAAVNDDGDFVSVSLDTEVTMAAGTSYGIRIRNIAGSHYATVATVPGTTKTLTFTVPQAALEWAINAEDGDQDLFGFGEADRESAELIVNGVAPGANLSAKLMLFDAAPGVHTADTGAIPEFDPQITRPPADQRKPEPPAIRTIKSDESALLQRVGGALVVRFLAEFAPPTGLPIPNFIQARWRQSDASPWTPGSTQPAASGTYSGEGVQQGTAYRIEFRYVTQAGSASDWAGDNHTIVGKTTPPPDVAGLYLEGEHVRWPYPAPPLDVTHGGGFQFRYHYGDVIALGAAAWISAIPAHDDLISGTNFALSLLPPGELTLMVKAVDADGNESATAAMLFTELVGPALANILFATDHEALGWPGIIEGGSVQGGDLVSDSASIFYPPAGVSLWGNPAPVYGDQFEQLQYRFDVPVSAVDAPCRVTLAPSIEGANQRIDYWAAERGHVFYGSTPLYAADPFYGPGAWRTWPGGLDFAESGTLVVRILAGGGSSFGAIHALVATLDVEDESELLLDIAIAPGGTALPVTKSYRRFVHVADLALLDDGGDARGVRIKSALPSLTPPIIECLDATGASAAGHVNARPQGQKA